MRDRRRQNRFRVLKGAIIAYNRLSSTIPCTVRDLSDIGCRIRLQGTYIVPDRFILLIELDGMEVPCAPIWRHGNEIGVQFVGPITYRELHRVQVVQPTP